MWAILLMSKSALAETWLGVTNNVVHIRFSLLRSNSFRMFWFQADLGRQRTKALVFIRSLLFWIVSRRRRYVGDVWPYSEHIYSCLAWTMLNSFCIGRCEVSYQIKWKATISGRGVILSPRSTKYRILFWFVLAS